MSDPTISGTAIIAAAVAAVGGILTAVLGRRPKGNNRADYAERLVGASVSFTNELQEELTSIRTELADEKMARQECERRLVATLRNHGITIPED